MSSENSTEYSDSNNEASASIVTNTENYGKVNRNIENDSNDHKEYSFNDDDEFGRLVDSLVDDGRTEVNSRNSFDEMFSGDNDYLGSDEFGGPRFSVCQYTNSRPL